MLAVAFNGKCAQSPACRISICLSFFLLLLYETRLGCGFGKDSYHKVVLVYEKHHRKLFRKRYDWCCFSAGASKLSEPYKYMHS